MTRIDPAYLNVLAENPGLTDEDHVICAGDTEFHNVGELRAAAARGEFRANRAHEPSCAPIDSYAHGIAVLKSANATERSRFEDEWKRDGLAAIEATRRALDAAEPLPRLSAAELSAYAPPDGWALALAERMKR